MVSAFWSIIVETEAINWEEATAYAEANPIQLEGSLEKRTSWMYRELRWTPLAKAAILHSTRLFLGKAW